VTHRRHATEATGGVAHEFRYRTTMPLLFLDELEDVVALHPRWSIERWNAVSIRRRDFGGDRSRPLEVTVRDEVERHTGHRPRGPVAMLGHVRTWGFLFNPLTTFFVYDDDGTSVEHVVLEVRSTPWMERHVYVLDGSRRHHRFAKRLHVSPFLGMDHEYVLNWSEPGERLSLHLGNRRGEERIFDASLALERRSIDRDSLADAVWRRPLATYGVTAAIYREALRLWRKRAPFHPNPSATAPAPDEVVDA
jgi:DUF1365 family protein